MMSTQPQTLAATPDSPGALASELLETGRSRPIGSIVGRLLHRWARLRGHHRYDDWRFERWRDLHLVVVPTVSNPRLLRTGVFFAEYIESLSHLACDARARSRNGLGHLRAGGRAPCRASDGGRHQSGRYPLPRGERADERAAGQRRCA
jgi:hypothetical protein